MSTSKAILFITLGAFVFASYYYGGVAKLVSFDSLKRNHIYLVDETQKHYIIAPIVFTLSFAGLNTKYHLLHSDYSFACSHWSSNDDSE